MIEYADVELAMPFDLRVPVSLNLVCVMRMDVDGRSWIPGEVMVFDGTEEVFRAMQAEKCLEWTRVVPRILSLKVCGLRERQSFRWSSRAVPEYRWGNWINWIRTMEMASAAVEKHLGDNYKHELADRIEAKEKGA